VAISIIPTVSADSVNSKSLVAAVARTEYVAVSEFVSGVYTITTSPSTTQADIVFFNGDTKIVESSTVDGSTVVSLGSDATKVYLFVSTSGVTNTSISITRTAISISGTSLSGTLDTINSTGNYTTTGLLYAVVYGAGGGGGYGQGGNSYGGGGGGSGFINKGYIYNNGTISVTIGTGGAGGNSTSQNAGNASSAGGTTTFGNITALGGNGGGGAGGNGGNGSASGGRAGFNDQPTNGSASANFLSVVNGTTGGGGGGCGGNNSNVAGVGGGSGVGTGGTGGRGGNGLVIIECW